MMELHDVAAALLDDDGSCRDVNFENPTWDGVATLFENLLQHFHVASAGDHEGREIPEPIPSSVVALAQTGGFAQVFFSDGTGLVTRFQVFVSSEEDGSPFVEITFFPQDLDRDQDVKRVFVEWTDELQALLRARRYYARYENASWKFGDLSPTGGVFLVSG